MAKIEELNYEALGLFEAQATYLLRPPRQRYVSQEFSKAISKLLPQHILEEHELRYHNQVLPLSVMQKYGAHFILYCHSQAGSRFESLDVAERLPQGFDFAAFDFAYCGNSKEMEASGAPHFISLGVREAQQTTIVKNFLTNFYKAKSVTLWGRKLGAAAIVLMEDQPQVMVLDTPFFSLKRNLDEKYQTKGGCWDCCCGLPSFIIRKMIEKRAVIDSAQLDLNERLQKLSLGSLVVIMADYEDQSVEMQNSIDLFTNLSCEKKLLVFKGTDRVRPGRIINKAFERVKGYVYQSFNEGMNNKAKQEAKQLDR